MKTNVYLFTVLLGITLNGFAQTDSLHKFLYYTNKNQKVDEIYFYDLSKKIVRAKQEEPGPLSIYLMDETNVICDTLNHKILPEFILYGRRGNVYITGGSKFEHIRILDSTFQEKSQFSTIETTVDGVIGMWRILKFDDKVFGLNGTGKKMIFQSVDLKTGEKRVLIPSQPFIKIQEQRMIDVNYFLSNEYLLIFVVPYQKLFKIDLSDFTTSEVVFPTITNGSWYYFYDHIQDMHYAVRYSEKRYSLHILKDDKELIELTSLIDFPRAIIDGNIHFVKRTQEGTMHYMVPILPNVRKEKESGTYMLKEFKIKH